MSTLPTYLAPLLAAEPLPKDEQNRVGMLMRRMYHKAKALERIREEHGPRKFLDAAIAIARKRGDEARNRLVETSMRLTMWYAKRYQHGPISVSFEELMSIGALRLLHAVPRWNPAKGALSMYLSFWIKSSFSRATGRDRLIRERMRRLRTCSLDAETGLVAVAPEHDKEQAEREESVSEGMRFVRKCLPQLAESSQRVIHLRFGGSEQRPHSSIAAELGMSKQASFNAENAAIRLIREHMANPIERWVMRGVPIVLDRRTKDFRELTLSFRSDPTRNLSGSRQERRSLKNERIEAARVAREAIAKIRAR